MSVCVCVCLCVSVCVLPRKSLMRSSLSSLHVLAELLAVPLTSRLSRDRSLVRPRSLTDVVSWWQEPCSLITLCSSAWSDAGTTRSLSASELPREVRSLAGELVWSLSWLPWSPECRRRLTAGSDSVDAGQTGCSRSPLASATDSVTGSRFCTSASFTQPCHDENHVIHYHGLINIKLHGTTDALCGSLHAADHSICLATRKDNIATNVN